MSPNQIVPLTIDGRIALFPLHSDNGRCYAVVEAADGEKISSLA